MLNAFTVDLEEWYQGLTSTNPYPERWDGLEERATLATALLLDLLRSCRVRATFFVLGVLAEQQPDLITRLRDEGHELALHGYRHRRVDGMTAAEFGEELDRGLDALWRAARVRPVGHRAPYFSMRREMDWAFAELSVRRFRYDSSIFPAWSLLYGDPGASRTPYCVPINSDEDGVGLVEFPITTLRAVGRQWPAGGGFYTRVLPQGATALAVRQANAASAPAVLYVHPWELDTGQRYKSVSPRARVTHYWGRAGLAAKLRALLGAFPFGTLTEVLAEWQS